MVVCQQCNKFNKEATEVGNEWICEDCKHEDEGDTNISTNGIK